MDEKIPVPANAAAEINRLHNEICAVACTTIKKAIRIGELLSAQKAQLKHGEWLPWLEANIAFTDRTARNYMRIYGGRDLLKSETVSDLTGAYRFLAAGEPEPGRLELPEEFYELPPEPEQETSEVINFLIALNVLLQGNLEQLKEIKTFEPELTKKIKRYLCVFDQAVKMYRSAKPQITEFIDSDFTGSRIRQLVAFLDHLEETCNLIVEHQLYCELNYGRLMNEIVARPELVRLAEAFSELKKLKDFKKNPQAVLAQVQQDLELSAADLSTWLFLAEAIDKWPRKDATSESAPPN